jgi:hypothetical protein
MTTIGELEREAGIGPSHKERFDFWIRFQNDDGFAVLKAGIAELKSIIRQKEREHRAKLRRDARRGQSSTS